MAAKRGKSQARRNGGSGSNGLPGWAWAVLGALLAFVIILVAPKYLKSGSGDGFFRPQPNPDAQPVPVAEDEDAVAPEGSTAPARANPAKGNPAEDKGDPEYDFYTLLPGKEVPLSDAELAATERAEAQRLAAQRNQQDAQATATAPAESQPSRALPQPVDNVTAAQPASAGTGVAQRTPSTDATASNATAAPASGAATDDNTRYLLQAGAFQASGQAEEMKARIALLGLGARVESAQIGEKTVYRVRMGPYGTASDLADAKRKLSAGGLPAMAIKVK